MIYYLYTVFSRNGGIMRILFVFLWLFFGHIYGQELPMVNFIEEDHTSAKDLMLKVFPEYRSNDPKLTHFAIHDLDMYKPGTETPQPIGIASGHTQCEPNGERIFHLDYFGMIPECRRKKYGITAIAQLCKNLKTMNIDTLHVASLPDTIIFYQKAGLTLVPGTINELRRSLTEKKDEQLKAE